MADPIKIDYISNWKKRLRGRLYTQFRNKVTWNALVDFLASWTQELEDATQTLNTLLDIDNSEGVQLDNLGKIVGQPRLGYADADYRFLIKARIATNRSTGTPEDVYSIFRAFLGLDYSFYYFSGRSTKAFAITVNEPITRTQALIGSKFLGEGTDAGAWAILKWQESQDSEIFTFDSGGLGFDVGKFAGAIKGQGDL